MTVETFHDGRITVYAGDCLQVLPTLADNSVDSVCSDPPYHLQSIVDRFGGDQAGAKDYSDERPDATGAFARVSRGFMGKQWDGGDIAFQVDTWKQVFRVLKPGGFIVAFSSSRTYSRMAEAMSSAGFVTHPLLGQLLDQVPGLLDFIGSLNDEQADAFGRLIDRADLGGILGWIFGQGMPKAHRIRFSGLSDLDRETEGWGGWRYGGQTLKPALEPIYMGQKPFSEVNGSANVQRWGVGALNIESCRVDVGDSGAGDIGRWPANVITDGSPAVIEALPDSDGQFADISVVAPSSKTGNVYNKMSRHGDKVSPNDGARRGDAGSAARFFWSPKARADDRLGSRHPTVKNVELIQELARMITPPGGLCLDLFAGTGTLGEAAFREGLRAILIEREPEYQNDIRRRMKLCLAGPDERRRESIKAKVGDVPFEEGTLFAGVDA